MNKQAMKSLQSQVTESTMAEPAQDVVFLPITVTAIISVPSTFLSEVGANSEVARMYMENLALEFGGDVVSVDIK